jgi:Domain of unknown function (DUF397)
MLDNQIWRKSSYSGGQGNCVEIATMPGDVVAVRDSKDRGGGELVISSQVWREFVHGLKERKPGR